MTKVKCPNDRCPAVLQVPDEFRGKRVTCKKCGTKFAIALDGSVTVPRTGREAAPAEPLPLPVAEEVPDEVDDREELDDREEREERDGSKGSALLRPRVLILLGVAGLMLLSVCVIGGLLVVRMTSKSELYGGVEVTSTEVRGSAYEFFPDSTLGFDFKRVSESPWDERVQWGFDKKEVEKGDFDRASLKEVADAITRMCKAVQKKHGVKSDNMVLTAKKGVFKALKPERAKEAEEQLIKLVKDGTGLEIKFIEPKDEIELQIGTLIPEKFAEKTVFFNLSNSGARGGCQTKSGKTVNLDATGVDAFTKKMIDRATPKANGAVARDAKTRELYIKAAKDLAEDEGSDSLRASFRTALQQKENTQLTGRKRIEIAGGIPWVVATYKAPAECDQTHVKLSVQQFQAFYADVRRANGDYPPLDLPKDLPKALKARLEADHERMPTVIPPENLIAGTEVFRVLADELAFGDAGREIYFHTHGQEAIVLGLMQKKWEKTTAKK